MTVILSEKEQLLIEESLYSQYENGTAEPGFGAPFSLYIQSS